MGVGTSVTFGVIAAGAAPMAYQWRFNGSGLPGATGANLTLTNTGLADAGNYYVLVTNGFGSVTSVVATLVLTPPVTSIAVSGVGLDERPSGFIGDDWMNASQHSLSATPLVITGAQMQSTAPRFYRAVLLP